MTVDQLNSQLAKGSYAERLAAIDELQRSHDPKAAAALRTALGDNDPDTRKAALTALKHLVMQMPPTKLGATPQAFDNRNKISDPVHPSTQRESNQLSEASIATPPSAATLAPPNTATLGTLAPF